MCDVTKEKKRATVLEVKAEAKHGIVGNGGRSG